MKKNTYAAFFFHGDDVKTMHSRTPLAVTTAVVMGFTVFLLHRRTLHPFDNAILRIAVVAQVLVLVGLGLRSKTVTEISHCAFAIVCCLSAVFAKSTAVLLLVVGILGFTLASRQVFGQCIFYWYAVANPERMKRSICSDVGLAGVLFVALLRLTIEKKFPHRDSNPGLLGENQLS